MIKFYAPEYRGKVKRLLGLLLPVIATELAMFGMNFFDASMSGQAGPVELAGTAMAGNLWMPLRAGFGSALMAGSPIVAQLIGAKKKEEIPKVIQQGLFLAGIFFVVVLGIFIFVAPFFYDYLRLDANVRHVAYWYGIAVCCGILPFFLVGPLRVLVDTTGHTDITMKNFLLALPINAVLNYIFIFGWGPIPAYGGIGAGIATGITYWTLFFLFVYCVIALPGLKEYGILRQIRLSVSHLKEYINIGVPIGFGAFMECGVFALTAFLIAKFGTVFIAADMAATNFCTIIYMIPLSIGTASTIVIGIEVGARRLEDAHCYAVLALQMSFAAALVYTALESVSFQWIAAIYTTDAVVTATIVEFMGYGLIWQYFDAVGSPLQGILRGYKDVKFPFYISVFAFWMVCLPYGMVCDYLFHRQAFCYWEGINISLCLSSCLLYWRLRIVEKKEHNKMCNVVKNVL